MLRRFKSPFSRLEKHLGYTFRRKKLLSTALLHRSFRFETRGIESDNQRMEFLGDAALSLVSAAAVYRLFLDSDEGDMTRLRSRITSGRALARIGASIRLGDELKVGKGEADTGGRERDSNIADALEAVLGAAYLDGGIRAVERIFRKLFLPVLEELKGDVWEDNPKGQLQKFTQRKWKCEPIYRIVKEIGPQHDKIFTVEVCVRGKRISKRSAEVGAAENALEKLN